MNNIDIKLGDGFHSLYNIPSAMAQNRSVVIQKEQQINVNSHGKFDQSMQTKQKQKQDIQQVELENSYHNDTHNHNRHQHQHHHQIQNQNKKHQELFKCADQDQHQEVEDDEEEEDEEEAHGEGGGEEEAMAPLKKGPWTAEEDALLLSYVSKHGDGNWNTVQKYSGVSRNGKSCRLRWTNHLRPHLKKGAFSAEEERIIIEQHAAIGNRWSRIAAMLPGRTDNEIKNFWNTRKKRRLRAGLSLYPAGVKPNNGLLSASTSSSCSDSPESMITSLRLGEDGSDINSSGSSLGSRMTMIDHHQFSMASLSNNIIQAGSHPRSMAIHTDQPTAAFPSEISIGQSRRCAEASTDVKKNQIAMSSTEPSLNIHGLKRGREATGFHQPLGNSLNFRYFSGHESTAALARTQGMTFHHQNLNIRSMDPFRRTQAFPYESEPPDPRNIRNHGTFIPTDSQHPIFTSDLSDSHNNRNAEARPNNPFMSISNHDDDEQKHLHGLKMELPSVQLTESADSSSGLSSPFTTPPPPTACPNMLPLSEVDSFGSTRNNKNETISSTSDGGGDGSLLDAVLIPSVLLDLDQFLSANISIADQPSAVSSCSRNASPMVSSSRNVSPRTDAVPPSYHQNSNNIPLVEFDPLSFLGGRSLTLLSDDDRHPIKMSPTSSEAHSTYVCQASGFLATGENNSDQKLCEVTSLLLRKMEGEEEDDLFTLLAFERPDSLPASDLCSIVTSVDHHQTEETTYNEGGLEAIFSQPSSSLDSDYINAMSGINTMWELGSCVWNNMPGAL